MLTPRRAARSKGERAAQAPLRQHRSSTGSIIAAASQVATEAAAHGGESTSVGSIRREGGVSLQLRALSTPPVSHGTTRTLHLRRLVASGPLQRCRWAWHGGLLHLDIKKLGRIAWAMVSAGPAALGAPDRLGVRTGPWTMPLGWPNVECCLMKGGGSEGRAAVQRSDRRAPKRPLVSTMCNASLIFHGHI